MAACGASQAEATDRLLNEDRFYGEPASTAWWWWRWYDATRARARNLRIPSGARSAKLAPAMPTNEGIAAWAERFEVPVPADARERGMRGGILLRGNAGAQIAIGPNGTREVRLAEPADTDRQLGSEQAVKAAQQAISEHRLAENVDLILDTIRYDRHAGASADERVDAKVREVTVTFVQVVDGVPVVSADGGRVHVRVDNEGTVTGIADSTRQVRELRDQPATPPSADTRKSRAPQSRPTSGDGENGVGATGGVEVDAALDSALQRRLRRAAAGGRSPSRVRAVPNTLTNDGCPKR